jgi:hypothetical protein
MPPMSLASSGSHSRNKVPSTPSPSAQTARRHHWGDDSPRLWDSASGPSRGTLQATGFVSAVALTSASRSQKSAGGIKRDRVDLVRLRCTGDELTWRERPKKKIASHAARGEIDLLRLLGPSPSEYLLLPSKTGEQFYNIVRWTGCGAVPAHSNGINPNVRWSAFVLRLPLAVAKSPYHKRRQRKGP